MTIFQLEEDKIKANLQLNQARQRKRASYGDELSADFIEEDAEGGDIGAIKAKYGKQSKSRSKRKSKEEEDEAEARILRAKGSSSYEPEEDWEEEEEELLPARRKKSRRIVDDYSDDE